MPVMDGTEAVRIIRSQERYKHIPIIAVTANAVKKDHDRYIRLGMNDVMTKPLSGDRLQEILKYWLERSSGASGSPSAAGDGISSYPGTNRSSIGAAGIAMEPIAGMDVESALERVNGKRQILFHMIEQFRLDYDSFMDQLRMMLKQSETKTALRMLHTLKGRPVTCPPTSLETLPMRPARQSSAGSNRGNWRLCWLIWRRNWFSCWQG